MTDEPCVQAASQMLDELARAGRTISYRDMAQQLGLVGPRKMARLTAILEALMAEDVACERPPRAALVVSRLAPHLPRPGFFDHLRRLGILFEQDPATYHESVLDALHRQT